MSTASAQVKNDNAELRRAVRILSAGANAVLDDLDPARPGASTADSELRRENVRLHRLLLGVRAVLDHPNLRTSS